MQEISVGEGKVCHEFKELNTSTTINSRGCSGVATRPDWRSQKQVVDRTDSVAGTNEELPSFLGWYRILRVRHRFSLFQAIRGALWLVR